MLMASMDQWDWKTSAPEFIPAALQGKTGAPSGPAEGAFGDSPCVHNSSCSPPIMGGAPCNMMGSSAVGGNQPLGGGFAGPFPPMPQAPIGPPSSRPSPSMTGGFGALQFGPAPGSGPRPAPAIGPSIHGPIGPCQQPPRIGPPEGGISAFMVPVEMPQDPSQVQMRAQYEWQIQTKDQRLRDLQNRLSREEHDRAQMQVDFERDRQGLVRHLNQLQNAVERYGIQVETAAASNGLEGWMSAQSMEAPLVSQQRQGSGLDMKMEQLSGLLREGPSSSSQSGGASSWDPPLAMKPRPGPIGSGPKGCSKGSSLGSMPNSCQAASSVRQDEVLTRPSGRNTSACGAPGSHPDSRGSPPLAAVSSTASSRPRVTFPHDVAPGPDPVWEPKASANGALDSARDEGFREVLESSIRTLERRAGDLLDEPARVALESLAPQGMREVVRRAQDAMQASGDCRDLSGLVQSLCRKIRRTVEEAKPGSTAQAASAGGTRQQEGSSGDSSAGVEGRAPPRSALRAPPQFDEGAGDAAKSRRRAVVSTAAASTDTKAKPASRRSSEPWSAARLDRLCKQGGFGFKQVGDEQWVMRLQMCDLEPPLGDEGMQVFCRWFHHRMQRIKESKGIRSMRQVRADVSFARNNLGDAAVGRLVTALQRADLHVATLNLIGNGIGLAGLRYVCDFLHEACCPVYEVHLGHNDIDDEAALELVRAMAEHPRYAAKRAGQDPPVQIWLRLNSNPIRDIGKVLWKLDSQYGANVCAVRNRQAATRAHAPVLVTLEDSSHWVDPSREAFSRQGSKRHEASYSGASRYSGNDYYNRSRAAAKVEAPRGMGSATAGGRQHVSLPGAGISSALRRSTEEAVPGLLRPSDGVVKLQSELSQAREPKETSVAEAADVPQEDDGQESDCQEFHSQHSSEGEASEGAEMTEKAAEEDQDESTTNTKTVTSSEVSGDTDPTLPNEPTTPSRGPPEETPEPDSMTSNSTPTKDALEVTPPPQKPVVEEEDEESPQPVRPIKLMAPPRILQRPKQEATS
mmetsp:Transcript_11336/g.26114  ORF Transcript_11336/g.26114 Transcript_11336/m.26114 type:complete len:1026 (-) Transcript_11336:72-3149(-)